MREINLHQLLHGYKGGHRRIAGTTKLDERDGELVTRLSDLSGTLSSGVSLKPYVTVYPLPSQRFFAVAKTWLDSRAPRSGCVLTHTLLVPLEEWGRLSSPRSLERHFRNPQEPLDYDFNEPIVETPMRWQPEHSKAPMDHKATVSYVTRYFGRGLRPIVWFDAKEPEEYLWRLLEHLWPQLRRKFSCCTYSLQQRSLEDGPFELLFAPGTARSRFLKLPPLHFVEPGLRNEDDLDVEPWCRSWAEDTFSDAGRPSLSIGDSSAWEELGDDPTGLRKISLIRELRKRASESPTAAVGALDVVESAFPQDAGVSLKSQLVAGAISAAEFAPIDSDGLTSLRLIDDRLRRESFKGLAPKFEEKLFSATSKLTARQPDAAIATRDTWLADSVAGSESAFVRGVLNGLKEVALHEPSRLGALKSHPDIASEIFRMEPAFAAAYLRLAGDAAAGVITEWLKTTREASVLREARRTLLPLKSAVSSPVLLGALLENMRREDIIETMTILEAGTDEFRSSEVRQIVAERIASTWPEDVRQWAAVKRRWSLGITEVVAATYPGGRQSFQAVFDESMFNSWQQAYLTSSLICSQRAPNIPYWLREIASSDFRVISSLVTFGGSNSPNVDMALEYVLGNVPELPFHRIPGLWDAVAKFETYPFYEKLFDECLRRLLAAYLTTGKSQDLERFTNSIFGQKWYATISNSSASRTIVDACKSGSAAVARSWKWLADTPSSFFKRNEIVCELTEDLLRYSRHPFPKDAELCMTAILRRLGLDGSSNARENLSSKFLRFAFDNSSYPLGGVVAEAFVDVYQLSLQDNAQSTSIVSFLFGYYDWDRGKDLRSRIVDTFMGSRWAPGDLAIAADRAKILRKIFKRLHRKRDGDSYIWSMISDLSQRGDAKAVQTADKLKVLVDDPNFYEEWD